MKGQWIGSYDGSTNGSIMIDIEESSSDFQGVAFLLENDPALPPSAASFTTPNKDRKFRFRTSTLQTFNPLTFELVSWETLRSAFPNLYPNVAAFSAYADVEGSWDDAQLSLAWTSEHGTIGQCKLLRSQAAEPSKLVAPQMTWQEYKTYVPGLRQERFLFRGQRSQRRLRTSFHRTGRNNLLRFLGEDILELYRHLCGRTAHLFNMVDPDQRGAFFNLLQHHGYPTPLLDWTYSPYVAAFFAYRGISNAKAEKAEPGQKVRVHIFDQGQWRKDFKHLPFLILPFAHLWIAEFLTIGNERMIPQQAVSIVTNVDDIESFVREQESNGKEYLRAIDMPLSQRREVIRELSHMGISAGSLFPGLDGACEDLKERNFDPGPTD